MRNYSIVLELGEDYFLRSEGQESVISVSLLKGALIVGKATLVTDHVDIACITKLEISEEHASHKFSNKRTLSEAFLKFLVKFPYNTRKLEFRFILDIPENLMELVENKKFDQGRDSPLENEILIRKEKTLPKILPVQGFEICESAEKDLLNSAFSLLKRNAYWRENSSLETFSALVQNSRCFFVIKEKHVIGFARVLTDGQEFASLWDVAVDEAFRNQGVATAMIHHIFTDKTLEKIPFWILFTDTAKSLYQKFGFASAKEFPNRKIVHKLRLQESEPTYMPELLGAINSGLPASMNPEQSHQFLFCPDGKRNALSQFWRSFSCTEKDKPESSVLNVSTNLHSGI